LKECGEMLAIRVLAWFDFGKGGQNESGLTDEYRTVRPQNLVCYLCWLLIIFTGTTSHLPYSGALLSYYQRYFAYLGGSPHDPERFLFGSLGGEYPCAIQLCPFSIVERRSLIAVDSVRGLGALNEHR